MPAGEDGRLASEVEALLADQTTLSEIVVDLVDWLSSSAPADQTPEPSRPPTPTPEPETVGAPCGAPACAPTTVQGKVRLSAAGEAAAASIRAHESAAELKSLMKEAMSAAFPLTGVTCVGCVHPHRILAINDYIEKNAQKVSKTALFKTAALLYQRDIREPALAEGVRIPGWSWRDIGVHYDVHAVEPKHQRLENVRTLANVRNTLEQSLMREDAESGERVLDKQNAELLLKVVTLQSKEISLFVDPPKPATANGKTAKTGSGSSGGTTGK